MKYLTLATLTAAAAAELMRLDVAELNDAVSAQRWAWRTARVSSR